MHSNGPPRIPTRCFIDGLEPERIVEPSTPREVADLLAEAAGSGLAVSPFGGGTALSLGNPIERYDIAVNTTGLGNILDYEPMDLVLSVQAGATFAKVQAALAEHGQHLPVETPFPDRATIGGMIATARSGPRRLSSGSMRDLLIGMSVAHASGTVTKCGGMVVKNVSGYDMPRLYHGSLGTLGVITSANFKVVPLPRAERTLIGEPQPFAGASASVARLHGSGLPFVALEIFGSQEDWRVAVRMEGRAGAVASLASSARQHIGPTGNELEDAESRQWWQAYLDDQAADDDDISLRSSVRPRESMRLIESIVQSLNEHQVNRFRLWASPGLGSVSTRWSTDGDATADVAKSLVAALRRSADHGVITSAPAAVKLGIDVWGAAPETHDVMRQLKREFDPGRVLNPGRFVGRL